MLCTVLVFSYLLCHLELKFKVGMCTGFNSTAAHINLLVQCLHVPLLAKRKSPHLPPKTEPPYHRHK
jgi:hypothetical protein